MTPEGTLTTVKQPHVNPVLCTGCGICETNVPSRTVAASTLPA